MFENTLFCSLFFFCPGGTLLHWHRRNRQGFVLPFSSNVKESETATRKTKDDLDADSQARFDKHLN